MKTYVVKHTSEICTRYLTENGSDWTPDQKRAKRFTSREAAEQFWPGFRCCKVVRLRRKAVGWTVRHPRLDDRCRLMPYAQGEFFYYFKPERPTVFHTKQAAIDAQKKHPTEKFRSGGVLIRVVRKRA